MPSASGARHWLAEHTSELEIRLAAPSLAELFAEAGRALAEVMAGAAVTVSGGAARGVSLRASDREGLLVAWLDELLFLAERDKVIYAEPRIERLTDRELVATVHGAPVTELRTQVKAATFHGLRIVEDGDGFTATVILDV